MMTSTMIPIHSAPPTRRCSQTIDSGGADVLKFILDRCPNMVWMVREDSTIIYVNKYWEEYTGLSKQSTFCSQWKTIVHPDDAPKLFSDWKSSLEGETAFELVYRVRRYSDGEYRYFKVEISPYYDDRFCDGVIFIGTGTDIHDSMVLTVAQKDNLEQESMYKRIVNAATDPIMTVDLETKTIVTCNSSIKRFQYEPDELIGKHVSMILPSMLQEQIKRSKDCIEKTKETDSMISFGTSQQMHIVKKDGTLAPITLSVAHFEKSSVRYSVAIVRDVEQDGKMQEEITKSKDEFLSTVSHEIRTPLFGMLAVLDSLLSDPSTTQNLELIKNIKLAESASLSLLHIVNNMVDYYRLKNFAINPVPVEVDIRERLTEFAAFVKPLLSNGVQFTARITENVPPKAVYDTFITKKIWRNILTNAARFTKSGSINMIVDVPDLNNPQLTIRIADTGIGIPADSIPKLFHPFTQVDSSDQRKFGGVGLGLALCKQLAELMGGSISFCSAVGKGSEFIIMIPIHIAEEHKRVPFAPDTQFVVTTSQGVQDKFDTELSRLSPDFRMETSLDAYDKETSKSHNKRHTLRGLSMSISPSRRINVDSALHTPKRENRKEILTGNAQHQPQTSTQQRTQTQQASTPQLPLSEKKVLVVDDNLLNQRVLSRLLSSMGCTVTVAANGKEALDALFVDEALGYHTFDAVVMDIQMPIMDGYEATRQIRKWEKENIVATPTAPPPPLPVKPQPKPTSYHQHDTKLSSEGWAAATQQTSKQHLSASAQHASPNGDVLRAPIKKRSSSLPILALTASSTSQNEKSAMDAGMDVFLAKPITKENLRQHIFASSQ